MADVQLHLPGIDVADTVLPDTSLPDVTTGSVYQQGQIKGFRVKDLPKEEQPREQVLEHGPKNRSTAELLATLIGSSGKGETSAPSIAQTLLAHLETTSDQGALRAFRDISAAELQQVAGIGPSKAAAIIAAVELGKRVYSPGVVKGTVIDDPTLAAEAFSQSLMWEPKEKFGVLHLNVKQKLIGRSIISVGTATETIANPRDVFRAALQKGAVRIVVAHNHPTAEVEPSKDDLALTKQLIEAGKLMSIPVLDHLILGGGTFTSLRQTTNLWNTDDV